jgi:cation diffusion facilitator family transporter
MWTNYRAEGLDADYPVGRKRLEPVGVLICAVVMCMASLEVLSTAAIRLLKNWGRHEHSLPVLPISLFTVALLTGIILLKAVLWYWSSAVYKRHPQNDSVKAIAQDNANDVISNLVALLAPAATHLRRSLWCVDPVAGIVISVYIIYTWVKTCQEQVEMIVGKRADPDFLRRITSLSETYHPEMQLDHLNAYHFGPKYLVELEMVMPEDTTLRESHDAGITLQHQVESMEDVERCFVHIDYQLRVHDDHDTEVPIEEKLYGGSRGSTPRAKDCLSHDSQNRGVGAHPALSPGGESTGAVNGDG